MRDCFVRIENHGDSFTTFAVDEADFWDEREIFVISPLEFDYLCGVVFDREVESFFFFNHTVSEMDFIFFLER